MTQTHELPAAPSEAWEEAFGDLIRPLFKDYFDLGGEPTYDQRTPPFNVTMRQELALQYKRLVGNKKYDEEFGNTDPDDVAKRLAQEGKDILVRVANQAAVAKEKITRGENVSRLELAAYAAVQFGHPDFVAALISDRYNDQPYAIRAMSHLRHDLYYLPRLSRRYESAERLNNLERGVYYLAEEIVFRHQAK